MALILHEQATNAVKYGGLSTSSGRVSVTCERNLDTFNLTWKETGGPPILDKPTRRGFGTELAARSASSQLGGALAHEWQPEGLTVKLSVPVDRLTR